MKSVALIALLVFLVYPSTCPGKEKPAKRSLTSISKIIVSGKYCAMIPKGAILYTPRHITDKDSPKLKGKLVNWNKFLLMNSGWIHMHQVTMRQAAGKEKIRPEVIKAYQSIGKMVIAHNDGDLVSVNPKALTPVKK